MNEISVAFESTRARQRTPAPNPEHRYPARIARQLALAHALKRRLDSGEFADYADMARKLGFTRARISQLMDLLLIAPDIQEQILFLEVPAGRQTISERALGKMTQSPIWADQSRLCLSSKKLQDSESAMDRSQPASLESSHARLRVSST
jgi:hypothetical protein